MCGAFKANGCRSVSIVQVDSYAYLSSVQGTHVQTYSPDWISPESTLLGGLSG
jgi:hypothetical protein